MTLVIAYFVFVLLGPVVFLALIRPTPTVPRFAIGCASVGMLMGAAWILRQGGQGSVLLTIGWLACVWLGWIVTIAMVVQALALKRGFGPQRKWSAALGAVATVLPWFGLSLAISAAG
jgi:hypothetical protein